MYLKTDGDKLFKDFLTNKTFSKQILSWNFKMEFCLNWGLVWKFFGWKLVILTNFLVKLQFVGWCCNSEPKQDSSKISTSKK